MIFIEMFRSPSQRQAERKKSKQIFTQWNLPISKYANNRFRFSACSMQPCHLSDRRRRPQGPHPHQKCRGSAASPSPSPFCTEHEQPNSEFRISAGKREETAHCYCILQGWTCSEGRLMRRSPLRRGHKKAKSTVLERRMSHRKWRESKQRPS